MPKSLHSSEATLVDVDLGIDVVPTTVAPVLYEAAVGIHAAVTMFLIYTLTR